MLDDMDLREQEKDTGDMGREKDVTMGHKDEKDEKKKDDKNMGD